MKNFLLAIILIVEMYTLRMWLICKDFVDAFHFSSLDLTLKLQDAVHNDIGFDPLIVRFFHNKVGFFIIQSLDRYLRFFDIRFGVWLFTIAGYLGILLGFYYLVKSKLKFKLVLIILLLLLPIVEVYRLIPGYHMRLTILAVPYYLLSIFGFANFIRTYKKRGIVIVAILIFLSIWYQYVLIEDMYIYCVR